MSTKTVQVKPLTLSSNIGTSNTTAIVSGMIGLNGVDLVQADFGTIIYGTFEPNTTREEAVSFTITANTAGVADIDFGVSGRGLIGKSPYGTGGITYAHSAGAKLVISNNPNLFNKFTAKDNNEVVTGAWEFPTPTTNPNPATKVYVDTEITATEGLVTAEAGTRAAADTALDNAMVKVTTDQSVAGVKTFSDSPIVPTATTATQAVNKSQVEAYIAANSGDIKATDSAFGTVRLDVAADDIINPEALTATADRVGALLGNTGTPSVSNKFVTETGIYAGTNFGDGSDGDVTISAPTTLTSDKYYNNLTVNNTLTTDGYRVFVKGTLSGTGTIKWGTPNNGSAAVGDTGGAGGTQGGSGFYKNNPGGAGGNGTIAGSSVSITTAIGTAGGSGGVGGILGGGTSVKGGGSSTLTVPIRKFGVTKAATIELIDFAGGTISLLKSSVGGGGAGGGDCSLAGLKGAGGGGGASGGFVFVAAAIWSGTFTINVAGGNGGNGSLGNSACGTSSGGGGGGGAGGVVVVIYKTKTWSGSYVLSGGSGGAAGGTATGATNGSTGTTGLSYEYLINTLL